MKDNQASKLTPGITDPSISDKGEMFIGWAPAPKVDRRFLLGALPLAFAATTGISYAIASEFDDPGAGSWNTGATHAVTGAWSTYPYPALRMLDESVPGGVRTVLVVTAGKCTSVLGNTPDTARPVQASGVLIERKNRQMLEVPPLLNEWLEEDANISPQDMEVLRNPLTEKLGSATYRGLIVDSKCFFGVMKPARGMTHKACASLCIRGGIPPSFWVRDGKGKESVMLMTDARGGPITKEVLPLVLEPVEATGEVVRVGDVLQFRADVETYRRI